MMMLKRWPLASFFLLAYACTWWIVPLRSSSFPVFPYGPDVGLLIVVALTAGRSGIRRILASLIQWRANPKWYAFAVAVPLAICLTSVYVMRLRGVPDAALPGPSSAVEFILILPVMILIGGPLGEEPAWRGYVLPILQRRHRPLLAVLILAAGHTVWHLPLFFANDPPPVGPFVVDLLSGGVVLAWLMNCTGRILLPIILHGAHNMYQQAFLSHFTGADLVDVQWLTAAGWTLVALLIIWRTRGTLAPAGQPPLSVPLHQRAPAPSAPPAVPVNEGSGSEPRPETNARL
jgi:membrane protease YdiL (CAAX protease family)